MSLAGEPLLLAPLSVQTPISPEDVRAAALRHHALGRPVVIIPPGKKGPQNKGWPTLRYTNEDLARLDPNANLGLLLGAASGLADVDLDCEEARALAPTLLPPTAMLHGRPSSPNSHYWFGVDEPPPKVVRYCDPTATRGVDKACLVELRSGSDGSAAQTMIPPSMHPSGERLAWAPGPLDSEPARIEIADLQRAVARLAVASLLARRYPARGSRHEHALALAGLLLRGGLAEKDTYQLVYEVARVGGSTDPAARAAVVRSTAERLSAGKPLTGGPRLAEIIGEHGPKVIAAVTKWLGLRATRDGSGVPPVATGPAPVPATGTITRVRSDVELARAARGKLGDVVSAEGALWQLDGNIWRRVPDEALHAAIVALDGLTVGEGEDAQTVTLSAARVRGLMGLAIDLDARPDYFATAGGVAVGDEWITASVEGLHREPLRPEHHARWRIEAEPGAIDTEPARWLALLRDMLSVQHGVQIVPRIGTDDMITAIGETIGLALIGRGATRDARHLIFVGPSNSGKSTVLAIISSLAPPEAQTAMTLHDLDERFRGVSLVGARLVLCPEMPARDLLDVERAKAVLTGDPITVERKYRDSFTIRPTAGWIVAANELPAAPDASRAIYRRWILVELRRQYPISTRDYAAEIVTVEHAAIVGWALRCAVGALARGSRLVPTDSTRVADQWARDSDSVTDWLGERTVRDPEARTSREQAWAAYRDYTQARGAHAVSLATFRRRLAAAGVHGCTDRRGGLPLRLVQGSDPPEGRRS